MAEVKNTTTKTAAPKTASTAAKAEVKVATTVKSAAPKTVAPVAKVEAKTVVKSAVKPAAKTESVKSETVAKVAVKSAAKKTNGKLIKVTLVKATGKVVIGMKKTIQVLGLTKIGSSKIHNDNAAVRGNIFKVKHLVKVEDVKKEA